MRRDKGDGAIYEETVLNLRTGKKVGTGKWYGQLDLGKDATGKRRRRKFTGKSRKQVSDAMRAARRELDQGNALGKVTDTVGALLGDFLSKGLPPSAKSAKTVEGYRWAIEDHLIPSLGGRRLRELTVDDVDEMLRRKSTGDRPLSRASLLHIHGVLKRALKWGMKRGRVARNVAELADTPQGTRRQGKALTDEQWYRVFELAQEEREVNGAPYRDPLEALYLLGITTPCRPGELAGLPWSCVDFEKGVVHFRQALHHGVNGEAYLGPLKTDQSRRSVAVLPEVLDALRRRKAAQAADRLRLASDKAWGARWLSSNPGLGNGLDPDLVFTTESGRPIDLSNLRRSFGRLLRHAGVEGSWTTYELRHSAISMMSHEGVPLELIADAAGHKNSRVTDAVYRHNLAPVVVSAQAAMAARLARRSG
jgi:integrase